MNLNLKRMAQSLAIATALTIGGAMEVDAQTPVFTDTFDAAPTNGATRVLAPDNSATGGIFSDDNFDVFGIVDRNVNGDFADDSVADMGDVGLIASDKTDLFLGFADTANRDNETGDVSVTWTASTAGATGLSVSFEIAAMGDFEPGDAMTMTASFDGGAAETLFTSTLDDDGVFTYVLQSGAMVDLNDPFVIDGTVVSNVFQTFTFPITGSGTQLTLTLNYNTNGGNEPVAIDNLLVTGGEGGDVLKGDVDLNGQVEFSDIPSFIELLISGDSQDEADCNCDGEVGFADIPAFIQILIAAAQ